MWNKHDDKKTFWKLMVSFREKQETAQEQKDKKLMASKQRVKFNAYVVKC